jgi:hypothetical protein
MKTFLKVLLVIVAAILILKLLPLALGLLVGLAALVAGIGAVAVGAIAAACCLAFIVIGVLTPIWLPVLVIIGLIALVKKLGNSTA